MRSATTVEEEADRLEQALLDLGSCQGASVALLHCPSATRERIAIRAMAGRARERRFVTGEVSLREHGLESPDALVRELLAKLVLPGENRACGFLGMLDRFREQHGPRAVERLDEAARDSEAGGDLTALARAYLGREDEGERARRAYGAWCDGNEPPRKARVRDVRRALSERTAQRSLNELSRLVRALGHRGLLVLLVEGDALAGRTDRQREKGYTVLREMVDNFDGWGGAAGARILLSGQAPLFDGPHSLLSVKPLRMRVEIPSDAEPPPPHRPWTTLVHQQADGRPRHRAIAAPEERLAGLRNLIRISEGLPPTERVTQMSVGQERLDRTIRRLFDVVGRAGSFFSVLVGEYGSGKTHLMMHLAERAIEDKRPVFWLNLERTNIDLGNPARHLGRFLEHSELPLRGRPNALALASRWTRSRQAVIALEAQLLEIASGTGEAAAAARKGLRVAESGRDVGFALESFLIGADLEARPGDATYRQDAYRRIFLWFELLARQEGHPTSDPQAGRWRGPVILIDEAENLYTSGRPPASRRTSLRSLAFYCGGVLPGTCVIMAMTPPAFESLKGEARDLLAEAIDMDTTLELEDVARFRRSLFGLKPQPVQPLTQPERLELCERVRRMHRSVRGPVELADWQALAAGTARAHASPRTLIRALIDELESAWWAG
ncbi:MAG TPA: BREX system ATP-binding domain-containing protein [Kofleriaceae bacterium]|nr:BREX system ATP-binding domain-containing protein [Kofleriaceae bacterium]